MLMLLLLLQGTVSGETKAWHRVTVTFDGPSTSEGGTPNPFRDYRLDVTFTKGTRSLRVPGFYAADGNAAESSATSGNKWRVRFCPDEEGTWTYTASFRQGTDIAASTDPAAGSATSFNGASGSILVSATDKGGRDHRGKGRLRYVGKHQLQFARTGEFFLKGGADSPENLLAFADFDGTPAKHFYAPHAGDWHTGDPVWKGSKGKNLIGALNYLSGKGMNSVYFLTMNVTGDGRDVWPWTSDVERYRFDISKLDQWEIVFSHMDKMGLKLHVVTQETENDQLLDGGALGTQRKIYYRELVARFAHHLGVVWNIGEENTNTDAQRKEFAVRLRSLDAYDNPIVIHTYPGQYDTVYNPLLGHTAYEGPSLQMGSASSTHAETVKWVQRSAANGRRWFVSLDEIGPANDGVLTDAEDFNHDNPRKNALWGNLMGGGAGCEWYFGYGHPHTDLTCEDWRSRDNMWNQTRHALDFFRQNLPFQDMTPNDGLVSTGWCLNKGGEVYAVYLPNGGTASLNVGTGTYSVRWFNPRSGGALQTGSVASVTGAGSRSLGNPPGAGDWAAVVKLTSGTGGGGGTTPAVSSLTLVNADSDADLGPLTAGQTLNLATLPTRNLNVRANAANAASVRFGYDANASYSVESAAPFALAGDSSGNYNAWTPSTGNHTITATPFSAAGATGTAGPALSVSFSVVDDASNAPPTVALTSPANGATFAAGSTITLTATASDPDGSVAFVDFLRGTTVLGMDTTSPYSFAWTSVPAGTYTLTARATDNDATVATSAPITITVTASSGPAVSSFTLINADTDLPMAGFDPLNSGATINLGALPTRNLNIRANASGAVSVKFGYDANSNVRVESAAPFALAGDTSGNYYAWTPSTGSHSVTATPYTATGAGGTAGTSKTITFTVTDSGGAALVAMGAPSDPGLTGDESGSGPVEESGGDSDGGGKCGATGLEVLLFMALAVRLRVKAKAVAPLLALFVAAEASAQTYQESGGIVVVEVESAAIAGSWVKETSVAGYTGSGYYRWSGGNLGSGGQGILRFPIRIANAGSYNLRIRNHHNHPDSTLENDCFTKMDSGAWIKTYSSTANQWTWHTRHEEGATHSDPAYTLTAGDHVFEISGRSANFRIDRVHLYLSNVVSPTDTTRPQSLTTTGTPAPTPPPPTPAPAPAPAPVASGPPSQNRPNDPDGCGGRVATPPSGAFLIALPLLLLWRRR